VAFKFGSSCRANDAQGYTLKSPISNALGEIFESMGEHVSFWRGCLRGKPESIDRIGIRIGPKPVQHSLYSYTDRQGVLFLGPAKRGLQLVRFAKRQAVEIMR
jgi:hypothetical protein